MTRRYAIISGLPGTGKSQLGRALSEKLGWPLISKDLLKESLADSLGLGDEEWSLRLSAAAMEVLYGMARTCPAAILEANFKEALDRGRLLGLFGRKVQVYCHAPPDVIHRRLLERVAGRHPIHRDAMKPCATADHVRELARCAAALDLPVPMISADTSLVVDVDAIAASIRSALDVHDEPVTGGRSRSR